MRVLNAAQSTLAHQGALVGHEFTYQAAADPVLSALTRRMLERETSSTLPEVAGMEVEGLHRYVDGAHPQRRNSAPLPPDRRRRIAEDHPASHRSFTRASRRRPAGRPVDALGRELGRLLFKRSAAVWRALGAFRPLRGHGHRDRRSHLRHRRFGQIRSRHCPIFGSDMARPQLVDPIARHLRGLLCGDARFYLAERLGDE